MAKQYLPKLGNDVHFTPGPQCGFEPDDRPAHATVVRVNDDGTYNIRAIDGLTGGRRFETHVPFILDDAERPAVGPFIAWSPEKIKFHASAAAFEKGINDAGYTLEQCAHGDQVRDQQAGITSKPPVNSDGSPVDADPTPSAAAPDVEQTTTAAASQS